jgi:acetate kinase
LAFTILVVNAGSATLKAALFDPAGDRLWQGQIPWNPQDPAALEQQVRPWLLETMAPVAADIALVAHRIVHGGNRFSGPTRLDASTLVALEALSPLAPLHNGPALALVRAMQGWLPPATAMWACFDTAFHQSLPVEARTYALPESWRQQGLRRYGFHGLNHQHIAEQVRAPRLISCHLGGGSSLCAIRDGQSVATTMGYTPLEGLVMATRSGSVDPGILLHQWRQGLSSEQLEQALSQKSGLLGLSGFSGDMRVLRAAAADPSAPGHGGAQLAIAVYRHQLLAGIGAMAACLGGVDAIALTGGIGQNDQALAEELAQALAWLQPFELVQIAADEEGQMARLCRQAANAEGQG